MRRAWIALLALLALLPGSTPMSAGGACPPDMAYIAGGRVRLGLSDPTRPWARPTLETVLAPYCIDRYEYPNAAGRRPRILVSWQEANAICLALGKRLCNEDEWERACSGAQGWLYPYGPQREPGRCATELKLGTRDFPNAGSHPDCVTPEGVFDLDGSVSEWVADLYEQQPGDAWERRVLRGSTGWMSNWYGQDCSSRHFHEQWNDSYGDDGFRCCMDAAPSSAWPAQEDVVR